MAIASCMEEACMEEALLHGGGLAGGHEATISISDQEACATLAWMVAHVASRRSRS